MVPRLRERIVSPPSRSPRPRWVVDPDFDLRYHLRRVALAGDGSHRELLDLAEQLAMTPLDLTRPCGRSRWSRASTAGVPRSSRR